MSADHIRSLVLGALLLVVVAAPGLGGDQEIAELLFEKGEKAYRKRDYEAAATYYQRALDEVAQYPEAAFGLGEALEKLGRGPDALEAFLKCRDQINAMESPSRKIRRLADNATKAIKRLGEGYAILQDLDRDFVKDCIAFGKRYLRSSPEWAKKALESAAAIEPTNKSVEDYLDRLEDVAAPAEGVGLYEPLILDDKLSNWKPGLNEVFSCLGGIVTADTPPDEAEANDIKIRLEGTWSMKASFRVLEQKGVKISHGIQFGRRGDGTAWALLIDWDDNLSLVRWETEDSYTLQTKILTRFRGDRWHEIRMDVEPGKLTAYFNGKKAFFQDMPEADAFDGAPAIFTQRGRFEIKDVGVRK